jgi:hypothetical protein
MSIVKTLSVRTFGDHNRYAVKVVKTRFNAIEFFCQDAENIDVDGLPKIVGQSDSLAQCLVNLPAAIRDEFLSRAVAKKGQKAVNLDHHPVKVVKIDDARGVLVECLGTKQRWYSALDKLVLIS